MEQIKFFRVINRINSILLLLLLLLGVGFTVFMTIQANSWRNHRSVEVAENPGDQGSAKIELVLGSVNQVPGHDVQYVVLRSKSRGGKFSSGRGGGEIRNVLFLLGENLDEKWLYANHSNYIDKLYPIKWTAPDEEVHEVIAMYYEVIEQDTNGDGKLDDDDLLSIAFSKPDGSGLTVLEGGVTSVIDKTLSKDGSNFAVLLQKQGAVQLMNFNPRTLELKSRTTLLQVDAGA